MSRKKSFVELHPVVAGFGILFGCAAVVVWWPLFLTLAVVAGVGFGLWVFTRRYDAQALQAARRRAALTQAADYEHHLLLQGDPRGVYGRYPPAI